MRSLAITLGAALVVLSVGLRAPQAAASPCGLPGTPTSTVYLPNITKTLGGPTGWVTPFIVQNVGASATTLEVSFYGFADGALVACRSVEGLAPGTSFADVPNNDGDLPDGSQFAVVVRSFGSQVVAVVNEQQGSGSRAEGLSYVGLTQGSTTVGLPYVAKAVGGWTTTIVIQDLGSADAVVTATFTAASGSATTLTRTIAAGGSRFIDPGAESSLASGSEYAVVLTSSQPIAAIVNAHNDAATVPAPRGFSYNGIAPPGAASTYLPYVARAADGARTTRVLVQNLGTKDATPTLTFRDAAGRSAVVTAPAAVAPGRVWSFDPGFLANGTSPCPVAGTATCVGTGQHALTVSGGTFAAVGVTLNDVTAEGMAGMLPATQRLYLPNITRTLGGTNGWTTPIVLESAGATSAVLRWYRFADGTLALTQYVAGLVKGAPVRIDPRDVSGLQDGSQYAVVVDATGGAVAAVLELNDLGGDGAMAYEGFAAAGAVSAAPAPRAISLSPASASVGLGAAQQFTATVTDTSGNAMTGVPLAWSVSPTSLGTISQSGLFTASSATGGGTVVAKFGSLSASAAVTVAAQTVTVGGVTFVWQGTAAADLYLERTITSADATTISAFVAADVASIGSTYARTFSPRPVLYVFPTTASYTTGLETIFGLSASDASVTGGQTCGLFRSTSSVRAVGLNWARIKAETPWTCARHELTHMMIDQIAKPTADGVVPAWINEGSAREQEFTVAGTDHWAMQNRYGAASAVAVRDYFDVSELTSQEAWNARTGEPFRIEYYEASQIVQLLRDDVTTAGVTRMFDLVGQGSTFDAAFSAVTGTSLAAFSANVPTRLQALSRYYPWIATADDTPAGAGLSYMLYGFAPYSTVTLSVRGQTSGYHNTVTSYSVDRFGTLSSYLGAGWPADTYTISATGLTPPSSSTPNTTVTASLNAVKASSVGALSLDGPGALAGAPEASARR